MKYLTVQIHQSYQRAKVSETVSLIYDGQNHIFFDFRKHGERHQIYICYK